MYSINDNRINENPNYTLGLKSTLITLTQKYPWRIEMYSRDAGIMGRWNIGSLNMPFSDFSFSISEKGPMDAKLNCPRIDFLTYYGNEFRFFYNNEQKYRGYLESVPDPKGGVINITPYHTRFGQLTFNSTISGVTFPEYMGTLINANSSNLGIGYSTALVTDYDSTGVLTGTVYNYETIQKFIDDYYKNVENVYYGVNSTGYFYLKKRSTAVTKVLYSGECQSFGNVTYKKDYSKIKATRYDVFLPSTGSGNSTYVATIPDGTDSYPYWSLENDIGIKIEKLNAVKGLTAVEAKLYAYNKIISQKIPVNIKISSIDVRTYDLQIGEKVRVWTNPEWQLYDLVDCDSVEGWYGNIELNTTDYIEGSGCINILTDLPAYYDFGKTLHFKKITKLLFMIKSTQTGQFLDVFFANYHPYELLYFSDGIYGKGNYSIGMSDNTSTEASDVTKVRIKITDENKWNQIEIPCTYAFRYLGFILQENSTIQNLRINVDDIKLFGVFQNHYEGNVVKLDYKISNDNYHLYDAELGDLKQLSNNINYWLKEKVEKLEAV